MDRAINVAILGGGYSAERSVALSSAEEMYRWLQLTALKPWLIDVREHEWVANVEGKEIPVDLNRFAISVDAQEVKFDAALLAIHGTPGENGLIQGYLDFKRIPYSTGDTFTEAISFNKSACKLYVGDLVPTARHVQIAHRADADVYSLEQRLDYPMFVKPNANGSSVGVSKAKDRAGLVAGLKTAFSLGDDVLVEQAISGVEVSCGLVSLNDNIIVFPITELVSHSEFFDYVSKYDGSTQEITPARIPTEVALKISNYSRAIYRRLNCRGIARIDYIISGDTPYFLEINTVPGMTAESIVPKQVRAMGQTMPEILGLLVQEMVS